MNRYLLIALILVAGLAVFMGGQSDEELLAPQKGGKASRRHEGEPRSVAASSSGAKGEAMPPWVAASLMDGAQRWQQRGHELAGSDAGDKPLKVAVAWASVNPPPPVAVRHPVEELAPPPPPPMAPRFPHAWVGRFNDEAALQASSAASAASLVARAVLSSPQSTWVVRAGDVIEGQWRIDRIQDRTMSLTYLPLQQQQTIVMR